MSRTNQNRTTEAKKQNMLNTKLITTTNNSHREIYDSM